MEERNEIVGVIQQLSNQPRSQLLDRIDAERARFVELLTSAKPDSGVAEGGDEWSLRDIARHVICVETLSKELIRSLALGKRAEFPRGALLIDEDGRPLSGYVAELQATGAALRASVADLPERVDTAITTAHPWFGELHCWEWLALHAVHLQDHVRQAEAALASDCAGAFPAGGRSQGRSAND